MIFVLVSTDIIVIIIINIIIMKLEKKIIVITFITNTSVSAATGGLTSGYKFNPLDDCWERDAGWRTSSPFQNNIKK